MSELSDGPTLDISDESVATMRARPAAQLDAPATIGRFEVLGKLGEGGMGVVYRGRDRTLDREVALKLVRGHQSTDARARLLREAQAMARVAHPNVVPVYEVGLHGESVFIAMELVPGMSLKHWLRAEPRPWRDVLRRVIDAGRGVAAAHHAGVLHRDLKPDNILIAEDGRARVLDFGLARASEGAAESGAESVLDIELTHHGDVVGTPGFMSPEHFTGTLTPLADQWSFAVTAYYAMFRELPWTGSDVFALRDAALSQPPRLPARGEVPVSIVDAILRGMDALPERRFVTLDAFLDELEAGLAIDPDADRGLYRRQRRGLAIAIVGMAVVNLLVGEIRTGFRLDLDTRGATLQGLIGFVAISVMVMLFRGALWRTAHDRRVVMMLLVVMASVTAHRALVLDDPVIPVLRTDAVFMIALLIVGGVTIERWFGIASIVMVAYLGVSYAAPSLSVLAFPIALIGTVSIAIWSWREPALRRSKGSLRPTATTRKG